METPQSPEPRTPPWRVLVVDDDPVHRLILCEVLDIEGLEVDEAADGLEAAKQVAQDGYDVMIIDRHMPGMDGVALCRYVRETLQCWDMPILFATGSVQPEFTELALQAGASGFIPKPCAPDLIRERVLAACRSRRPAKPEPAA